MVGKPNPQSKTPRLILQARNDEQKILIRKVKEIISEKGLYALDIVRPALEAFVKDHWPPNPQLQIPQFTGQLPLSHETSQKLTHSIDHNQSVYVLPDFAAMSDADLLATYRKAVETHDEGTRQVARYHINRRGLKP
jgi:hypothetical protein